MSIEVVEPAPSMVSVVMVATSQRAITSIVGIDVGVVNVNVDVAWRVARPRVKWIARVCMDSMSVIGT